MSSPISAWLGVDTGGTFTDFVFVQGQQLRIHKVLSTPDDPSRAILTGLRDLQLESLAQEGRLSLVHGSTVATNAALERKGVATAYVTNEGLEDVLTLGRQNRPALYDLTPDVEEPPVPAERCFGVAARTGADGRRVQALDQADLEALVERVRAAGVEAVAINLVFSFLDDTDEARIAEALSDRAFVSRSSGVLPEAGEYERGIATWLNAWLGPRVQHYLARLQEGVGAAPVSMMQSSGGTVALAQAGERAVNLLLSGPAGGLAAARYLGQSLGEEALLTFDMGGTSTDVAMVRQDVQLTSEGRIGPWPVAVPMVDMHTIGAGGGSLAMVDAGGALRVGPESAGSSPGPACYARGGAQPTVTDANLVLGRLQPAAFLGGAMDLDEDAARRAFEPLAARMGTDVAGVAQGVIDVANEHMARALRTMSIQRGDDPRGFRLCCFGGAGGLHVCALAQALGMGRALVPVHGGVLSALGMLVAPRERQLSRSLLQPLESVDLQLIRTLLEELEASGRDALAAEGVDPGAVEAHWSLDCRYQGQTFTLNLDWREGEALAERFGEAHEQRYGHRLGRGVELVNLRVAVQSPAGDWRLPDWQPAAQREDVSASVAGYEQPVPVIRREALAVDDRIEGPALITEQVSTTWLEPGWQARVHGKGHLLLDRVR